MTMLSFRVDNDEAAEVLETGSPNEKAAVIAEKIVERAKKLRFGDPMDRAIDLGTVVHEKAAALFERRVDAAYVHGRRARALAVDLPAQRLRVGGGREPVHRDPDEIGIAEKFRTVGVSELHRFDEQMDYSR